MVVHRSTNPFTTSRSGSRRGLPPTTPPPFLPRPASSLGTMPSVKKSTAKYANAKKKPAAAAGAARGDEVPPTGGLAAESQQPPPPALPQGDGGGAYMGPHRERERDQPTNREIQVLPAK